MTSSRLARASRARPLRSRAGAARLRRVRAGSLPGGASIATWHLGAHDTLAEAYGRLKAWLEEHEREPAAPAWEVYWWIDSSEEPDPSSWPATADWRTELVQPIGAQRGTEEES